MDPDWPATEEILSALGGLSPAGLYSALLLASYLENLLPPLPGDLVVVAGGYFAAVGRLHPVLVYLAASAGSWAGFLTLYGVGRLLGRSSFHGLLRSRFPRAGLARVEVWFRHWGFWLIAANRFLSGTRAVVSLFAGIAGLPWRPVAVLSLVSCLAWNGLLVAGGWWLGAQWENIVRFLGLYNRIVLALLAVALAAWIGWRFLRRRRRHGANSPPEDRSDNRCAAGS